MRQVFSKVVRKQAVALAVVSGLVESAMPVMTEAEDRKLIVRIKTSMHRCEKYIEGICDTDKKYKRYEKEINELAKIVLDTYEDGPKALVYINTVLAQVEDVVAQMPFKPMERRADWVELRNLLFDLYDRYDPDFEDTECIDAGLELYDKMNGGQNGYS